MRYVVADQVDHIKRMYSVTPLLGLVSVGLFVTTFFTLGFATPQYDLLHDYISMLGAQGQPFAIWWNLIGFVSVGILFAGFGWAYSRIIEDNWVGLFLMISGVGFAMGAIPADFINPDVPFSKAHFVSICLALAGWCLGLARIGHKHSGFRMGRMSANLAGLFAVFPMIAMATRLITAPLAHRLVLVVVLGWVVYTSIRFIGKKRCSQYRG